MRSDLSVVDVTPDNLAQYPQVICFINPKNEYYPLKIDWIKEQYRHGLRIKLLFPAGEKKPLGFIEYIPGDFCWRAVSASGYMFIHCIWTYGKKNQNQGLGRLLLAQAEKDAEGMLGVAAVTSDKAFMANRSLFLKNGYTVISESGKDQLLVKSFREGLLPFINPWQAELKKYRGLTMVYSKQCPWVARFIEEAKTVLDDSGIKPEVVELKNPSQAQRAPSLYGVFNLIHYGKLLADRYISTTRFRNILKKEGLLR